MKALDNALICAILAPAGPHRSRMLGTLFKDERSQRSPAYSMLNKMYQQIVSSLIDETFFECCFRYLDRIISPHDTKQFESLLAEHQKATTADGKIRLIGLKRMFWTMFCRLYDFTTSGN